MDYFYRHKLLDHQGVRRPPLWHDRVICLSSSRSSSLHFSYGEMLQPDLRRTGIQLQIRLAEKAPLYRYSLLPGKVVILSGSVGRKSE